MSPSATPLDALASQRRQSTRLLQLHFPQNDGPASPLYAHLFDATESLGRSFDFRLTAISEDAHIPLKDVLGKRVTIELLLANGRYRSFNAHVGAFSFSHSDGGYAFYRLQLMPWTEFMRKRQDWFIFHEMTTEQAIRSVFGEYPQADFEFRLKREYGVETFRVQAEETDYNYVWRRIEEKGWTTWFEHGPKHHRLIITDDTTLADPLDGQAQVRFHGDSAVLGQDAIDAVSPRRELRSGQYAGSSFDFKNPRPQMAEVDSRIEQGDVASYEVYEYTGAYGFSDPAGGQALTRLRMEEIDAEAKLFEGTGNARAMAPGHSFELTGHYALDLRQPLDRQFLVVSVRHHAVNNLLQNAVNSGEGGAGVYRNQFTLIRKTIAWHPGRNYNSRTPHLYGLQSAIVVGPPGEEIYCDAYGRVRVQFHWDRAGVYDDKSSCWMRVSSSWAGSNFGAIALPRVGQEVLVQWLDGNPDLPIVTGRVYNQANMPPWPLPDNRTQSGVLSRSSKDGGYDNANAIRFEDKRGQEQLWLHAEKDQLTEVEHDEDKWVGNDRRKTVDRDETNHIGRDRSERVEHNERVSVGNDRDRDVGGNETVHIAGNYHRTVGGSHHHGVSGHKQETVSLTSTEWVGLAKAVTVGGAMNTAVALAQFTEVGLQKTTLVGLNYHIDAGEEFKVTVGESSFLMKKDGTIEIKGKKILISADGGPTDIIGTNVNINP